MTTDFSRWALPMLLASVPLAAQTSPTLVPSAKGDPSPVALTDAQWQAIRLRERPQTDGSVPQQVHASPEPGSGRVLFDDSGDGRMTALGTTYKAMFGPDGFTYVPFFGSAAPQNYPVHFRVRSVTVGDVPLAFDALATASRSGSRVTLDRGAVRVVLDLAPEGVEQTLVIDTEQPGDVVVELAVTTELIEDAAQPGLQFGNDLGRVDYGTAFLVQRGTQTAVAADWNGDAISLRVPAKLRDSGPVVIDPILATVVFAFANPRDARQPDIAYDSTSDRYMLVWEYAFSAADHDIFYEFHSGDGSVIPGTVGTIDSSAADERSPRVANVNVADRFVVVYEKTNPALFQGRTMIFGRLHDAVATSPTGAPIQLSDPSLLGNNWSPDVGGDSGTGPTWCVAWMLQVSATESWILERAFSYDGSGASALTTFVASGANKIHADVSVSQSNGRGLTPSFGWCLAYCYQFSPNDWDVFAASIDSTGGLGAHRAIDTNSEADRYPSVSSPATDIPGAPLYMVTYERQSPAQARGVLVDERMTPVGFLDLTGAFGLGAYWVHCESDGCRFAVTSGAATITVATLGFQGSSFVLHEAPQALTGTPSYPRLCSKRSGNGRNTAYAIAWVDESPSPDVVRVTTYSGRQPGATFQRRVMGCSTLRIDAAGLAFLGETATFSLQNAGSNIAGLLLGLPVAASTALCSACPLGVDLLGPTVVFAPTGTLHLRIPCTAGLVGATLAIQGFEIGSGPCVLGMRFTDTIDFTIR